MTYSISISGSANTATKQETAEEGRKFVKALDGVSSASLNWSDGEGVEQIDLKKEVEPSATE